MHIEAEKVSNKWKFTLDGKTLNIEELSRKYNISCQMIRKHLASDTLEKFNLWLAKKKFLHDNGIHTKAAVYYREGEFITAWEICHETGLTVQGASLRGLKFERGEITKKQLFQRPHSGTWGDSGTACPDWNGLGNEDRSYNLDKIPNPTDIERKYCS